MMPLNFSAEEMVDMILIYGECRNGAACLRLYAERFPHRRQPTDSRIIVRAITRLRNNERVVPVRTGGPRPRIDVRAEERILNHFAENPGTSTRKAGRLYDISHTAVHKILKRDQQHPFSVVKVHALKQDDFLRRIDYANWALRKIADDPHFITKIIWTDESLFTRNAMWNRRVVHHWAPKNQNPHVGRELAHQTRWSLNVWAGIKGNDVIGPVFINGSNNGRKYLEVLNQSVSRYVDNLPLAQFRETWYQHDGAPPHVAVQVRQRLNQIFGRQWIGRFADNPWPPRSPDLTPLDYFFWGWVKQLVFKKESRTEEEMKLRIGQAFNKIKRRARQNPNLMRSVHENNHRRLVQITANGGRHIELRRI